MLNFTYIPYPGSFTVSQGHQQVNNGFSPAGETNPAERTIGHDLDT